MYVCTVCTVYTVCAVCTVCTVCTACTVCTTCTVSPLPQDGLSEHIVRSPTEVFSLLQRGGQHRTTADTKMNHESSRSHAVFTIILEHSQINFASKWEWEYPKHCVVNMKCCDCLATFTCAVPFYLSHTNSNTCVQYLI